jgi:hypothetical protein
LIALTLIGVEALRNARHESVGVMTSVRQIAPYASLVMVGALIVVAPFAAYYMQYPETANARVHLVSMFSSGWLEAEQARTGQSALSIILTRFSETLLLPFHGQATGFYRPGAPFVGMPMALPVAIGMGIVAAGFWRRRYAGLAVSFVAAAGALALTEGTGYQSNRFSGAIPLLCLFGAVGIGGIIPVATRVGRVSGDVVMGIAALSVGLIGAWNVQFFFHDANQVNLYSDANTQVANALAYELRGEESGTRVYFAGPPRMWYDGFANISFIAPEAEGITVEEPWTPASGPPLIDGPTLFVFLPERAGEMDVVRGWYPDGVSRDVVDDSGQTLYIEYRVDLS